MDAAQAKAMLPRAAASSDIAALVALEQRVFSYNRLSRRSFQRLLRSSSAEVIVVGEGTTCMGYAVVLLRQGSRIARIYSMAVDPRYARRGIASMLLAAAEQIAFQRAASTLRLEVRPDNLAAITLYRKSDYRPFGYCENYYSDSSPAMRMQKALSIRSEERQRRVA